MIHWIRTLLRMEKGDCRTYPVAGIITTEHTEKHGKSEREALRSVFFGAFRGYIFGGTE